MNGKATTIQEAVLHFCETNPPPAHNRAWLRGKEGDIYVRATEHLDASGMRCHTIDLANIALRKRFQRKQVFSKLLDALQKRTDRRIYIENVSETYLKEALKRRDFFESREGANCYLSS